MVTRDEIQMFCSLAGAKNGLLSTNFSVTNEFNLHGAFKIAPYTVSSGFRHTRNLWQHSKLIRVPKCILQLF